MQNSLRSQRKRSISCCGTTVSPKELDDQSILQKFRKIWKPILYGSLSVIVLAIISGLLYYKQKQNNEAQLEQNKLTAFSKYRHIGDFGEYGAAGLAIVQVEVDGNDFYGMINGKYEEVVPCIYEKINQFEDGVSVARLNGKYAVINTEGSIIKHLNYTNILDFSEDGFAKAYIDNFECYINRQGEAQCSLYEYIGYWEDYDLALVKRDGKYGYMNKNFEEVVECKYNAIRGFSDGLARVERGGLYGYVDNTGKVIIPLEYDNTDYDFYKGIVKVNKNGKWGVIDKSNNVLVPFKYSKLSGFGNESYISGMPNNVALAERNGGEVLVNINGEEISALYDEIRCFGDKSYAVVVNRYGDVTFGAIGKDGKEILACVYTSYSELESKLE